MKIRVYKILKHTKVEGPGIRYCIWVQGCSRKCKGCWAKATWDKNGGTEYDTKLLLEDIINTKNIEGVTFLGGEPFEQLNALKYLAKNIQKAGLSVVCFTGNKLEDIQDKSVLKYIDILIDGAYEEENKDLSRPWVGSKNQRYHFLSNKYNEEILKQYHNKVEINVNKDGTIFINGMGDFKKLSRNIDMYIKH